MTQDIDLILKIQSGDSGSFAELYDRYFDKIYRFIYYKTSHRENAEDLTSQTFAKALEKINSFKINDAGTFSAWLYRIARNNIIDYYRTNHDHQDIEQTFGLYQENDMENKLNNQQELEKIQDKLDLLKPEQKEIIVMRVWNELSYKEISQIVGKSEASCKMTFSRAIRQLKTTLVSVLVLISFLFS